MSKLEGNHTLRSDEQELVMLYRQLTTRALQRATLNWLKITVASV